MTSFLIDDRCSIELGPLRQIVPVSNEFDPTILQQDQEIGPFESAESVSNSDDGSFPGKRLDEAGDDGLGVAVECTSGFVKNQNFGVRVTRSPGLKC